MKTLVFLTLGLGLAIGIVLSLGFTYGAPDPGAPDPGGSGAQAVITICHCPPFADNCHTITIDPAALPAHLAHGDTLGPCEGDNLVDVVVRNVVTIDGVPVHFNGDIQINSDTGAFEGTYEILSPPGSPRKDSQEWLPEKVAWVLKDLKARDDEDSVWKLSGFSLAASVSTRFSTGHFMVLNQVATGSASSQTVIGVSSGALAGPSDFAAFIESVSTFSEAGLGRISFEVQHLWASGKTATTQGTMALVGNPVARFGPDLTLRLTMDIDEMDGDNSDGIMAGIFVGEVTVLDAP